MMSNQPNDYPDERRKPPCSNTKIDASVIIQSLLLASTIGFGAKMVSSVDNLTVQVALLNTTTTVNSLDIAHLTTDLENHIHKQPHYNEHN
jgi:hypothetical protein